MPNRKEHVQIGGQAATAFVGAKAIAEEILKKRQNPNYKINPFKVLGKTAIAYYVGRFAATHPDKLEPASHPNHRDFFHSLTTLGIVGYGTFRVSQGEMNEYLQAGLEAYGVSYASHLIADSMTPKGLPLI